MEVARRIDLFRHVTDTMFVDAIAAMVVDVESGRQCHYRPAHGEHPKRIANERPVLRGGREAFIEIELRRDVMRRQVEHRRS